MRIFDWKEYAELARSAGAEGCVLIKNDKATLPVKDGKSVAVYGRTQFDYIKSGTGSGGLVNTPYTVNIYEGLKASPEIFDPRGYLTVARDEVKKMVIHKIDCVLGSANTL